MVKKGIFVTLLSTIAILSGGCFHRSTSNYDMFPDIADAHNAIVDESVLTAEDIKKQEDFLKKLDSTPVPPYTINAGDKINIYVYNHNDLTISTTVAPDGRVGMMFIGEIKLGGLTLKEAAQLIEKELSDYIINPSVSVIPYAISSQTASIAGGVSKPGVYEISNGMRLADLFSKAGGGTFQIFDGQAMEAVDYKHSIFIRDGAPIKIDFEKAITKGDRWNNILLHRGDYIYVATRSENMVYVLGDVRTPHKRPWDKDTGVLQMLVFGEGLNETYWQYGIIIRGGINNPHMYKVDIDGILQGRKENVKLQPGDILYVPKDNISEYNVFVRKLFPTGMFINYLLTPASAIRGTVL